MWNVDFSNVSAAGTGNNGGTGLTPFSLRRINSLEVALLTSLNFDVKVGASEYAKYYFLIRTMLMRGGLLDHAVAPLNQQEAKTLENRTNQYQNHMLQQSASASSDGGIPVPEAARRSRSVDWGALASSSVATTNQQATDPRQIQSFTGSQQQHPYPHAPPQPVPTGPVLSRQVCLEQLVTMNH